MPATIPQLPRSFSTTVSTLGVHFDSQLTMWDHVSTTYRFFPVFWTVWHPPNWRLTVSKSRRCPAGAGASFQLFLGGQHFFLFFNATGLLKNWKTALYKFICSYLTLFIVPSFFFLFSFSFFFFSFFFSFFFFFSFSFSWGGGGGGDGPPAPPNDASGPETVTICSIRTASIPRTKTMTYFGPRSFKVSRSSRDLEWSACQIEGFFSEQKLFQKITFLKHFYLIDDRYICAFAV